MSFMTTTNGDLVRRMSDEQIAELVADGCPPGLDAFHCAISPRACKECWLRWLKKEANR